MRDRLLKAGKRVVVKIGSSLPGGHGGGSNRHGRNGADIVISVPAGTVIADEDTGEVLADLTDHEDRHNVARGGRGGWGPRPGPPLRPSGAAWPSAPSAARR